MPPAPPMTTIVLDLEIAEHKIALAWLPVLEPGLESDAWPQLQPLTFVWRPDCDAVLDLSHRHRRCSVYCCLQLLVVVMTVDVVAAPTCSLS